MVVCTLRPKHSISYVTNSSKGWKVTDAVNSRVTPKYTGSHLVLNLSFHIVLPTLHHFLGLAIGVAALVVAARIWASFDNLFTIPGDMVE
jgi:hypothetical protein